LLNRYYLNDLIISKFLSFLEENKVEVLPYLNERNAEKNAGIAERRFSIMSVHLKQRLQKKDDFLRASYWYLCYHPLSM